MVLECLRMGMRTERKKLEMVLSFSGAERF